MSQTRRSIIYDATPSGGCARKLPALDTLALVPWMKSGAVEFMADAALLQVEGIRLIQSLDVITPIVPDAADFGRIAAVNALSDIYVKGAAPLTALATVGVPDGGRPEMSIALDSARDELSRHGCELIGGHSVIDAEAKLGFAVTGRQLVDIGMAALPGDSLILTKDLGVGLIAAAFKSGISGADDMAEATNQMLASNAWFLELIATSMQSAIHASTDVSGFGLAGHALELARRANVRLEIRAGDLPIMAGAITLAEAGVHTAATWPNVDYVAAEYGVDLTTLGTTMLATVADPQTSGGVLLSVDPSAASEILDFLSSKEIPARGIGSVVAGEVGLDFV